VIPVILVELPMPVILVKLVTLLKLVKIIILSDYDETGDFEGTGKTGYSGESRQAESMCSILYTFILKRNIEDNRSGWMCFRFGVSERVMGELVGQWIVDVISLQKIFRLSGL
jgi:hypothetical protein